jgi:hypothetical protein
LSDPLPQAVGNMKNTAGQQLEFGVNGNRPEIVNARQDRLKRAKWWFGKMRQVVNLALPQQPMAAPRPEQTYLKLRQHSLL